MTRRPTIASTHALGVILESLGEQAPVRGIARKRRSADPAARYKDGPTLAADVRRCLDGRAVGAHPERILDRLARFGRTYRLPIFLVLTYLVARLLFLWFSIPAR